MIKQTKRGLLITRFWYIREVDPQTVLLTGLTRDGVFLIEQGEITKPVCNFRFNESPVAMKQGGGSRAFGARLRRGIDRHPDRRADAAGGRVYAVERVGCGVIAIKMKLKSKQMRDVT
jgi:hypothetical protein